jgi:hypothetical protein
MHMTSGLLDSMSDQNALRVGFFATLSLRRGLDTATNVLCEIGDVAASCAPHNEPGDQ